MCAGHWNGTWPRWTASSWRVDKWFIFPFHGINRACPARVLCCPCREDAVRSSSTADSWLPSSRDRGRARGCRSVDPSPGFPRGSPCPPPVPAPGAGASSTPARPRPPWSARGPLLGRAKVLCVGHTGKRAGGRARRLVSAVCMGLVVCVCVHMGFLHYVCGVSAIYMALLVSVGFPCCTWLHVSLRCTFFITPWTCWYVRETAPPSS